MVYEKFYQNKHNENIDCVYKDSAKAARIYELILDNFNLDQIESSQVETKEFAKLLIDRCPDLLEKFSSMANGSTIH